MARSSGPTSALVLAFLMVFTTVLSIEPQGDATHVAGHQAATTGCLEVAAAPDFHYSPTTPMRSAETVVRPNTNLGKGEYNQRTIRIANNCDGQDINEIRFRSYSRQEREILDVNDPFGVLTLNSPGLRFRSYDVGEPVRGKCYSGQLEPCGFAPGTVIESVSADGSTATISRGTTACLSDTSPPPCPPTSVMDGIRIGCNALVGGYDSDGRVIPPLMDACGDEALVTWIADRSFASGWTVREDNRAGNSIATQFDEFGEATSPFIRELIFTATTTQTLRFAQTVCGDRTIGDGNIGASGDMLNSPTEARFDSGTNGDEGKLVFGAGIPSGTTIVDVLSATQVQISNPAPPGGIASVTIGTPPPCSPTLLRDTATNFLDLGVTTGMTLNIQPGQGPVSGRYTVATVASNEITFWPPAAVTVRGGLTYSIFGESNRNATLLPGTMGVASLVSRAQDFTIGFAVKGGADDGTKLPIEVIGYKATYPSYPPPALAYESTCAAPSIFLQAGSHRIARCLLPTDHTTRCPPYGLATTCRASPGLYIRTDGGTVAPEILSTITRDMDSNGHIDRIDATFSKRLDPRTFDPFLFSFSNRLAGYDKPYNYQQYVITNGFLTDRVILGDYFPPSVDRDEDGSPDTVSVGTFLVREQPYYDTGGPDSKYFPYVKYSAPQSACAPQAPPSCGVRDLAGNRMKSITGTSLVAMDGAPPVMVGAWMREGYSTLDVFFSEPVGSQSHQSTVLCIETPPDPPTDYGNCRVNMLEDDASNFFALGVVPGNFLIIESGPAQGSYEITAVQQTRLSFKDDADAPPITGDSYSIAYCVEEGPGVCGDDLVLLNGGGSTTGNAPCDAVQSMGQFNLRPEIVNDKPSTKNVPALGWHYRFTTLSNPGGGGGTTVMGACDVHPLHGDSLAPALTRTYVCPNPNGQTCQADATGLGSLNPCPPPPTLCNLPATFTPRIHDFASFSCESEPELPVFCPNLELVYLNLPATSGVSDCTAPTCDENEFTDAAGGFGGADTKVEPGMKLRFFDGPGAAGGPYTVTNVVGNVITFDPPLPTPQEVQGGNRYYIERMPFNNLTWPSGGVEVRPHSFARHATYPLVVSADMDIQEGMPGATRGVMRVKFNGPVAYPYVPGQNRTDNAVTHADMDVASATGLGQGPQGFTQTLFAKPGVDTILLETDHPARDTDVDNAPAYFKVHCDRVQGTNLQGGGAVGKSSFIPCDDPDRFYGWDEDPAGVVTKADVAVVDVTQPRITRAETTDSNHDGYVDGVQLTFSEPVNDASYCLGATEPDFCRDTDPIESGMITFHDPYSPNPGQWETRGKPTWDTSPRGGFRWDTGALQNDNVGILQLINTTLDPATGAHVQRTRNFQTDYGETAALWTEGIATFHRQLLPTDYLPHLTVPEQGLFWDMAKQPVPRLPNNVLPSYCQFLQPTRYPSLVSTLNWNGPDRCTADPTCLAMRTDLQCRKDLYTVTMLDGSPPVVWRASTVDWPWFDEDHCTEKEKCHKDHAKDHPIKFGNGTIDGYKLRFSEPVKDGPFCPGAWRVAGYEPASGIHNVTGMDTYERNDPKQKIRTDDNEIIVRFNETVRITSFSLSGARTESYGASDLGPDGLPIPVILTPEGKMIPGVDYKAQVPNGPNGKPIIVPDTGTRPELTYSTKHGCGVKDHAGNTLLDIDAFAVVEEDGAAPVIVQARGVEGSDFLSVKFSEPVDDGNRGPLVRDDFNYYDIDRQGVAGKSSLAEVCHGDADYVEVKAGAGCVPHPLDVANLPLGSPGGDTAQLTTSDLNKDRLSAVAQTIREIAPSVDPVLRQAVPNVRMPFTPAVECLVPNNPITDLAVEDLLTDASGVTLSWSVPNCVPFSYEVKIGNGTSITDFDTVKNPAGIVQTFAPELGSASTNETQTLKVAGLRPDTTYYFMLRPVNIGETPGGDLSNQVSAHTARDSTPPDCLDALGKNVVDCPLLVTSDNCRTGRASSSSTCTFKWNLARDEQSPFSLVYRYKVSDEEIDRVLGTDPAVSTNSATVTFDSNGTQWFHVAAFSGGGFTPTSHYEVLIGAGSFAKEDIKAANDLVDTLPIRVQVGDHYVNQVHWTLPSEEELQQTVPGAVVVGIEIWRRDGNTFVLVKRFDGSYDELQTGNWTDNTVGAGADSEYRVQMVFEGDPEQVQLDPQSGYTGLDDQTPQGIPAYAWILIGVGLALLVAGIVIYFVLRGKQQEQQGSVAYAWESANPDQIGIDEATGLPVHEVRCPSCNNPFQAIGNLPLPVTCPNCGTTGTLD